MMAAEKLTCQPNRRRAPGVSGCFLTWPRRVGKAVFGDQGTCQPVGGLVNLAFGNRAAEMKNIVGPEKFPGVKNSVGQNV